MKTALICIIFSALLVALLLLVRYVWFEIQADAVISTAESITREGY